METRPITSLPRLQRFLISPRLLLTMTCCLCRESKCSQIVSLDPFDRDRLQDDVFFRSILSAARDIGNLVGDVLPFDDLTENGVLAGEVVEGQDIADKISNVA